jgi:hypothetical protein
MSIRWTRYTVDFARSISSRRRGNLNRFPPRCFLLRAEIFSFSLFKDDRQGQQHADCTDSAERD